MNETASILQTQCQPHSDEIGELMGALAKAQAKIASAVKSKVNPYFKSKYADLPAIWEACKEPLSSNGLSVVQMVEGNHDQMYLTSILGHSSGQWIKSKIPLILAKKDPQSLGSCITYARRYSLAAMVGVCGDDEDDDSEAATKAARAQEKRVDAEVSIDALEAYLQMWVTDRGAKRDDIFAYMKNLCELRKWSYAKCMEAFEKKPDYTQEQFAAWISPKASQE